MVNSANLCIFEGRMAKDPQFSTIQIGSDTVQKAMFSIAVDRALTSAQRQKAKNGDQSIKTCDFIQFSLLGPQVDTLRQYFPKGKSIRIMARYTTYQTKDQQSGQTQYGHIFEVDNIGFTVQDSKNIQGQDGGQQNSYQQQQNNGYQQQNYQQQQYQNNNYQQQQQQPQSNFAMFDEAESPF